MRGSLINDSDRFWSIVLAGGVGKWMSAWIHASFVGSDAEQFCFLHDHRSIFQLTLDRARLISPGGGIIAVTAGEFEWISKTQIDDRRVELLVQPVNRGTTFAIYLALSHIMACDPDACVAIYHADHYVESEATFVNSVRRAMDLSALIPNRLLLIGATPDTRESEYGWLEPGDTVARYGGSRLSSVMSFRETPRVGGIRSTHQAGCFWSTFIIIGTARTFFEVGTACIPKTLNEFYRYRSIGESCEDIQARASLAAPHVQSDFSEDVLQHVPRRLAVFQVHNLRWSDCGRPGRIMRSGLRFNSDHEQN